MYGKRVGTITVHRRRAGAVRGRLSQTAPAVYAASFPPPRWAVESATPGLAGGDVQGTGCDETEGGSDGPETSAMQPQQLSGEAAAADNDDRRRRRGCPARAALTLPPVGVVTS
jgi:hypothetical protein